MLKLIFHILVLLGVVFTARHFALGAIGTTVAFVAGSIAAHIVYERVFGSAVEGVVSVRDDDPLMLDALSEAKQSWPSFLELYRDLPQNSMVKFRLSTSHGVENVWGDLLVLRSEDADVHIRTPPIGKPESGSAEQVTVPLTDIIDWQVVLPDESLLGGFTQRATFRIIERDSGALPEQYVVQLARYKDIPAQET